MELLHKVCSLGLLYMEMTSQDVELMLAQVEAGFGGGEMWKSRRSRTVTAFDILFR